MHSVNLRNHIGTTERDRRVVRAAVTRPYRSVAGEAYDPAVGRLLGCV